MKTKLFRGLAVLTAALTLWGCTGGGEDDTPDSAEPQQPAETAQNENSDAPAQTLEEVTLLLPGNDGEVSVRALAADLSYFDGCPLVRADECGKEFVQNVSLFRGTLEKEYGMKVGIASDWLAPGEEVPASSREILVGLTNRPESAAAAELKEDDPSLHR